MAVAICGIHLFLEPLRNSSVVLEENVELATILPVVGILLPAHKTCDLLLIFLLTYTPTLNFNAKS